MILWYSVNKFKRLLEGTIVNETIQVPPCSIILM